MLLTLLVLVPLLAGLLCWPMRERAMLERLNLLAFGTRQPSKNNYDKGASSIPAHAFHCFQLASNSALASSSVATWGRAD